MVDLNTLSNNVRWRKEICGFLSTGGLSGRATLPENYVLVAVLPESIKVIALDGEKTSKMITIAITSNYPFAHPTVKIGEKPYGCVLGSVSAVFRKIINIDAPPLLGIAPGEDRLSQFRKAAHLCLCCATITCSDNWGPCHTLKDVLHEIYFNWQKTKYYRLMCLIKKVLNEKIGTCVPVHEFLLPPGFGNVYYKFHNLG